MLNYDWYGLSYFLKPLNGSFMNEFQKFANIYSGTKYITFQVSKDIAEWLINFKNWSICKKSVDLLINHHTM